MNDGLLVRRRGDEWIGVLRCGAATPGDARDMADAFLDRRSIRGQWVETNGGRRLKVGIAGLRRFDVVYLLTGKP